MTDMTELQAVHRVPKAIGEQKLKVVASPSIVPPAPPGLLGTNCLVRFAPQTRPGAVRATRTSSRMLKSISSAVSAHPLHKTTATCHKTCVCHAKACSSYQKKHVKYSRANLKGANFSSHAPKVRAARRRVSVHRIGAWFQAPFSGFAAGIASEDAAHMAQWPRED